MVIADLSEMEAHAFSGPRDDAFHEHNARTRKLDGDHIAAFGFGAEISQAIDEVDSMILVGGQHAAALDPNRQQHEFENDETSDYQGRNPQQRITGIPAEDDGSPPTRALIRCCRCQVIHRERIKRTGCPFKQ